ncbi:MAG: glutamine synthetase family protein [Solirubrobacteraceae bacterium]
MAPGFIEEHALWTDAQREAGERLATTIEQLNLREVRISWGDQHGIVRGKTLTIPEFLGSLQHGKDFQFVTTIFDTTNHPIVPPFAAGNFANVPELNGLPDGVLVPDPLTFRVLPWVEHTGWILADAYFQSGREHPFSTRGVLRRQLSTLRELGYDLVTGLELEFYIFRLEDAMLRPEDSGWPPEAPRVAILQHGYQYLTESRSDEISELLRTLRDHLLNLGLPLSTIEDEWGPGQIELTFEPQVGLTAADSALLARSALKQVCRRLGYHATFMAKPALPNLFGTGWHIHQSLTGQDRADNAFRDPEGARRLSPVGERWLAGLLAHAFPACVFTTPTITGYKRFLPDSFAPDRITWAVENRAAMLRVIGAPGSRACHIENRVGDPAANPYLYLASQVACGIDGVRRDLHPGDPTEEPYTSNEPRLPLSLMVAVDALDGDPFFRSAFGATFVDYIVALKRFEIGRFLRHVTDWEQREYFEMY